MKREYHCWHSAQLERQMELLVFGHAGARVLVFPTRDGRFYEYENLGLIEALREKIEEGQLQLFCVDNFASETFYCFWRHPAERIQRHIHYEDYLLQEVLPFMDSLNTHPCTIAHGASLGAYHAVNISLRHPHRFQKVIAFSGRYDLSLSVEAFHNLFDGYYDENIYFHTPTHFLPNLDCEWRMKHLQQMDIVLSIGKDDPFLDNNLHLSRTLREKGLQHSLHIWNGRAHRASAWREMIRQYL